MCGVIRKDGIENEDVRHWFATFFILLLPCKFSKISLLPLKLEFRPNFFFFFLVNCTSRFYKIIIIIMQLLFFSRHFKNKM